MDRFPHIPDALLTALEKAFPERSPEPTETHDQLMVRAGEAKVIRFLRARYQEQSDNLLA